MRVDPASRPIFLLGVGRCGSTFQQTWLNRTGQAWIWGEHDGLIGKFLAWGQEVRSSQNLRKFSYPNVGKDSATLLGESLEGDATHIAWMNGFTPADIFRIEREAITSLFRTRLPTPDLRWGFKEIRYGGRVKVAERLLNLFPQGQILHTVREPLATIESSIAAWNRSDLVTAIETGERARIDELYRDYAERWQTTTRYFLDLESQHPERVLTSRLESFAADIPKLCAFLSLTPAPAEPTPSRPINGNNGKPPAAAGDFYASLRLKHAHTIAETATRAGYLI